jgi:two-component system response regulator YesN
MRRRHFAFPPIAYLLQRRMLMADTLLRETMLRIGEIGQRVGYDDPHHFPKLFKTSFGMPPSSFHSMERAGVTVLRRHKK